MDMNLILASIGVFLVIILVLVAILLVAKAYLSPSGNVNVTINGKDTLSVPQGGSLLSTLSQEGIFLPSACGGKGSCGQCKLQVTAGQVKERVRRKEERRRRAEQNAQRSRRSEDRKYTVIKQCSRHIRLPPCDTTPPEDRLHSVNNLIFISLYHIILFLSSFF